MNLLDIIGHTIEVVAAISMTIMLYKVATDFVHPTEPKDEK